MTIIGEKSRPNVFQGGRSCRMGAITGSVWAFVDAFVIGVWFAWIYNRLVRRHVVAA